MPTMLNDLTPLTWRALTREDLPAVSELLTAVEHLDDPPFRHSLEELYEQFDQAGVADPVVNAVVGFFGTSLLAYGWNVVSNDDVEPRTVVLRGAVHPAWRFKGIGRELLAWQIERAQHWFRRTEGHGPLALVAYVDDRLPAQRDLYERAGLLPRRWYADMHRRFTAHDLEQDPVVSGARLPEGLRLRPFDQSFAEATREAHNVAFAGVWGSQPVSRVSWQESLSRSSARPEWSWLVTKGDTVVGYAMNAAYPQDWAAQGFSEGWTERLGVRPNHRGQGIAKALLAASMRSFATAGLEGAGLGVDSVNPFGAVGLYRALGYVSADTVLRYQRDVEVSRSAKSKKKS